MLQGDSNLQSFSQNNLPLKSKLALLILYNEYYSDWIEKLLLLYEYFQLMSQGFLLCSAIAPSQGYFDEVVVYFFKLLNPSYLLEYDGSRSLVWSILAIIFALTGIKYLLTFYIVWITSQNRRGSEILISIFRGILKLQTRFTCFFVTSFWVNMILNISNKGFEFENSTNKTLIITIMSILIVIEYLYSFLIEMQFCDFLPRKNFLSGKNNEMQLITLVQKLMIQILQLCFRTDSEGAFWVCSVFNLILSVWRTQKLCLKLPLYHSKALFMLGDLTSVVLGLHAVSFIGAIALSHDSAQVSLQFLTILWIFAGILLQRISRNILQKRIFGLLYYNEKWKPELLLQKITFHKELIKTERLPAFGTEKIHFTHFFRVVEETHGMRNLKSDEKDFEKNYLLYVQKLLLEGGQDDPLMKLFAAKLWFKEFGFSSRALKITGEIIKKPWSKEYISALFLLQRIQKAYLEIEEKKRSRLDFIRYTENQVFYSNLKNEMIKQAQMKKIICQNMLNEISDIGEIFNKAQLINRSKIIIEKKIELFAKKIPDYWITPLLACSEYFLVMEHSSIKCAKYQEMYTQKYIKYEKYFASSSMVKENIYQGTNGFFILGGLKSENGVIKYCSKSIEKLCGGENSSYISKHISALFMPSMQGFYKELFRKVLEKGDMALLQKIHRVFLYNKNGYMIEADFTLWIHPYITESLLLNMMIRPVFSFNDYLLVNENGDIEGASERIYKILNLRNFLESPISSSLNIKSLSKELFEVNHAFNLVYKMEGLKPKEDLLSSRVKNKGFNKLITTTDHMSPENYHEAMEVFNQFKSGGKEVTIEPLSLNLGSHDDQDQNQSQKELKYHCRIANISREMPFLKLFILSKMSNRELIRDREEKTPTTLMKNQVNKLQKENSWRIMTPKTQNKEENFSTLRTMAVETTSGNELAPSPKRRDEVYPLNTEKNTLLTEGDFVPSRRNLTIYKNSQSEVKNKNTESLEKNRQQAEDELNDFISVTATSRKNNTEKEGYKFLKSTLTRRTHSKIFLILCFSFYGAVGVVLVCQILLKEISAKTMDDLVIKKDLLNNAQLRSYYACKIPFAAAASYLRSIGFDPSSFFGAGNLPLSSVLTTLLGYYEELVKANHKILNLVDTLDEEIFDEMFAKDVRIYGSIYDAEDKSFMNFTSFQAVDQLGLPINYIKSLFLNANGTNTTGALGYIMFNPLGDFLTKNKEITSLFQESVNQQRDYLRGFIVLSLVISPLLLLGVALMLILIIWRQYSKERKYLEAFIKLHPTSIRFILETTRSFEDVLMNDASFEDKETIEYFWNKSAQLEGINIKNTHYKFEGQKVNAKITKKKYFSFVFQVGFYVVILTVIPIWSFLSSQSSLNIIYNKHSQLQLANKISEETNIDILGVLVMFITNNTFNISQTPSEQHSIEAVERLTKLKKEVYTGFQNYDGTYDPLVKDILYDGVDCSIYGGIYTGYCSYLNNLGVRTDLVSLLSFFTDIISGKLELFQTMDRSVFLNLLIKLYTNANMLGAPTTLLPFEALTINGIVEKQLMESIADANKKQNTILVIFVVILVGISILIWLQILSKIKELNNDFKKVLQVFPPRLILSSFLLKQFINKISHKF